MSTSSGDAAEAMARTVAGIRADMEAMSRYAREISGSLGSAAGVSTNSGGGVNPGGASSSSFSAQTVNATGYAQNQGMRLGSIGQSYATTGMSGQTAGRAAVVGGGTAVAFAGKMGVEAFNDLRVGRETALDYELDRRIAFTGTGDFSRFQANMSSAMNGINVQNRAVLSRDVATALNQGMGQMMRYGGNATVGERNAAQAVGGYHTLGAMAGMDPASVSGGMNTINSAQSYYALKAMGVDTRDPTTGQMLGPEAIVNQFMARPDIANASADELAAGFAPGEVLGVSILQAAGGDANAAELIKQGMLLSKRSGAPLKKGDIESNAKAAGAAGTENTQGLDSESERQRSEQERIAEYANDVTKGIDTANGWLRSINDHLTRASGWERGLVGGLESGGGILDTMGGGAPGMTGGAVGGATNIVGTVASHAAGYALARTVMNRMGGAGGAGGAGASGLTGAGRAAILGSRVLGPLAIAGSAFDLGANVYGAAKGDVAHEQLDKGDWWQRVGWRTLQGAGAGFMMGGPVGALVGGGIGLAGGVGEASYRESKDNDQAEEGGKGYAEGSWYIEKDQTADIHQGEMIIPNRIAEAVRTELRKGSTKKGNGGNGSSVTINLTLQRATENEAIMFAKRVKSYIEEDDELEMVGSGTI